MKKNKPGHHFIGVGCGTLLFNKKGEIFLMRRSKNSRNEVGYWNKLGGTVEYGEKVITTLKREAKEETGVEIDVWGYLEHTDHIIKKDKQHWVGFNYLANVKKGEPRNMEPNKFDEVGWFDLKKLPKKLAQPTRESVRNYLAGKYIKLK